MKGRLGLAAMTLASVGGLWFMQRSSEARSASHAVNVTVVVGIWLAWCVLVALVGLMKARSSMAWFGAALLLAGVVVVSLRQLLSPTPVVWWIWMLATLELGVTYFAWIGAALGLARLVGPRGSVAMVAGLFYGTTALQYVGPMVRVSTLLAFGRVLSIATPGAHQDALIAAALLQEPWRFNWSAHVAVIIGNVVYGCGFLVAGRVASRVADARSLPAP